jgi:hypothetical protein
MRIKLIAILLLFAGLYAQAMDIAVPPGGREKDGLLPVRKAMWSNRLRYRLLNDLAVVSARLKLYPLAMKCYFKANFPDSLPGYLGKTNFGTDTAFDEPILDLDTSAAFFLPAGNRATAKPALNVESLPVKGGDICASFDDGKTASAYAILVQVKQPSPGKRRSFTGINNVGHMFITLIKYNTDNSVVYRSFGFYPNKSSILSATPLHPSSPSVFKDDIRHEWDELAGKFISPRRFRKLVEVLQSYEGKAYHLNHNNCTDFGLAMARLGGIDIADTRGTWPLGRGNNPANAGQSLLEQKINNSDEECPAPLLLTSMLPLRGSR